MYRGCSVIWFLEREVFAKTYFEGFKRVVENKKKKKLDDADDVADV